MAFPFDENPNVMVITCRHALDENEPILYASRDSEDGMWQFLCGKAHQEGDAKVVGLREIYERDKSLAAIAQLPLGCVAERKHVGDNWAAWNKTSQADSGE